MVSHHFFQQLHDFIAMENVKKKGKLIIIMTRKDEQYELTLLIQLLIKPDIRAITDDKEAIKKSRSGKKL